MPYKIKGFTVRKKSGKIMGHSKNPKKYIRVLQGIEHGWKPTGKPNILGKTKGVKSA